MVGSKAQGPPLFLINVLVCNRASGQRQQTRAKAGKPSRGPSLGSRARMKRRLMAVI